MDNNVICKSMREMYSRPKNHHRFGFVGYYLAIFILYSLAIVLVPLFIGFLILSPIYFWFYDEKWISPKDFFHFDRSKIQHLNILEKIGCEYCEFANSTLQWVSAIGNEIEKHWCPIKNQCDPNCSKVKEWRKEFLDYNHSPEELDQYYHKSFLDK